MNDASHNTQEFKRNLESKADDSNVALNLQRNMEILSLKNKRRSKKDKTGRNYICGCGKEYLSYPALYTHIKTKHGGIQPEGTKNQSTSNSKRGRPKKVPYFTLGDKKSDLKEDKKSIADHEPQVTQSFHQNSQSKIIESIPSDFVEKADISLLDDYEFSGETDPTIGFPILKSCHDDRIEYHPFHRVINNIKSNHKSQNLLDNNFCDTIIGKFLFSCSKIMGERLYLVFAIFFRNLRECLNQFAPEVIQYYTSNQFSEEICKLAPKKKEGTFCEVESPDFLPLIAEKYIFYYLPKYCPHFDQQLAAEILIDFCEWLSKHKLTRIKLEENGN